MIQIKMLHAHSIENADLHQAANARNGRTGSAGFDILSYFFRYLIAILHPSLRLTGPSTRRLYHRGDGLADGYRRIAGAFFGV